MKEDLLFGRIALLNNIINQEQLDAALNLQKKSKPMRSVSYILRQKGQIKRSQVKAILQAQKKNLPRPVKSPEERKEDMAFGYIAFRHDYLTINDLVKCLKLQGDVAKRGLLFRLSEILYNDEYLTYEQIEEVVQLQQDKILPCSQCQTPYNIVGLPAKARFPCRKCQKIIEVPESLASEDESELLEKYKSDIEEGILKIQQMPVVQAVVEDEEDEDKSTEQETTTDKDETSEIASPQEETQEQISTSESTASEDFETSEETTAQQDTEEEKSETQPSEDLEEDEAAAEDEFSETQTEEEDEAAAEDEFSETQTEEDEDEAAAEDEFSETQPEEDEAYDLISRRKHDIDQSEERIEEEVFAEVESTSSSEIKHAWPREISLDTDEMYAQEMPDLEDVTAKATEKMKNDYNNQLKRKAEFSITTSDLSFFPEDTNTTNLEIGALQSLTSFSDDEFSVMEDDFFEQTVYKKDQEEVSRIDTSDLNNNRFSFTSKMKVETKNEDDVVSLSSAKKKAKKKTQKKDRRTQMLRMNLELSDEDPDELFEDDMISIGPDVLKKHKKKRK
ncbi:hypothetical protein [Candidatus Uabimicrobium amorphum]|uniref:hypothetical protein n=1 Tax=Uabimicrobium amorphum TaxID=2596890 RepID=UPI0034A165DD